MITIIKAKLTRASKREGENGPFARPAQQAGCSHTDQPLPSNKYKNTNPITQSQRRRTQEKITLSATQPCVNLLLIGKEICLMHHERPVLSSAAQFMHKTGLCRTLQIGPMIRQQCLSLRLSLQRLVFPTLVNSQDMFAACFFLSVLPTLLLLFYPSARGFSHYESCSWFLPTEEVFPCHCLPQRACLGVRLWVSLIGLESIGILTDPIQLILFLNGNVSSIVELCCPEATDCSGASPLGSIGWNEKDPRGQHPLKCDCCLTF